MTILSPDERLCPFCAETIKVAAAKCRFCQSGLAAVSSDARPVSEPARDAEPWGHESARRDRSRMRTTDVRLVTVLLVLCLLLAATLGFLVDRSRHPDLGTAPNGQVTDGSFRSAVMSAASDAATRVLSYSWQTSDSDREEARALMGPRLAQEYDDAMDQVAQQTATSKLTLKATVLSAGLLSSEEHRAKVLLFVDMLTSSEGSEKQQLDRNRVVMELTRKDGDWTVSQMDAF